MTLVAKPFSPELKADILTKFIQLTGGKCPMGGHQSWLVMDGFSSIILQQDPKQQVLGGPAVPAAILVCNYCGFVAQIALGRLGLLVEEG
jgi:actin-like ATPase involved in cell morphogenesis